MSKAKDPKRRKRRERRRRRQAERDPRIGYYAHWGVNALCDGDGCIIAGSREAMARLLDRYGAAPSSRPSVKATTFSEILAGMRRGGAYCFDEEAYARFLAPGRRAGLPLEEEDFSDPGPLGVHLVRIGLL